jgi:hypothetical protein
MVPLGYATSDGERPDAAHTLGVLALAVAAAAALAGMGLSNSATFGLPCTGLLIAAGTATFIILRKRRRRIYNISAVAGWVVVGLAALFAGVFLLGLLGIVLGVLRP